MAIYGQRNRIMSQAVFTGVPKTKGHIRDQEIPVVNDEWHFTDISQQHSMWGCLKAASDISMDMLACDTGVEGCRFFQGTASALGPVMKSMDHGRLNSNHWSTDNGWLKALSAPLLDFNIREALELGFLSGAVCQTKESWAWNMGSNSGTRPWR